MSRNLLWTWMLHVVIPRVLPSPFNSEITQHALIQTSMPYLCTFLYTNKHFPILLRYISPHTFLLHEQTKMHSEPSKHQYFLSNTTTIIYTKFSNKKIMNNPNHQFMRERLFWGSNHHSLHVQSFHTSTTDLDHSHPSMPSHTESVIPPNII